jgi:cadmium resistance protein CadD (predicted permease)
VNLTLIAALAATGFAVAFFHAALPTHWLPFVLVGRAQGWRPAKVLAVTGLAGAGHVLFTAALGLALTSAGLALAPRLGQLFPKAVGVLLVGLGLFYLARQVLRHGHSHADPSRKLGARSEAAAIVGLVMILTFSPCEAFLPVYLANVSYGWAGFLLLSLVLVVGTGLSMLMFTGLCLAGADRFRLERLQRYESALIGAALCLLGVFVVLES